MFLDVKSVFMFVPLKNRLIHQYAPLFVVYHSYAAAVPEVGTA
jgi:hypothetical protein